MGLRNTWARMPAQLSEEELAQLAPELEQLTLLRESALPQKRRTLESSRGNVNETKLSNITRELGKAILPDVDFNAAKERGEGLPSIGRQAQGVDDLEASLESLRREPQAPQRTDWTPLLRFSERLGAKTPATKYNPPQEPPTPLERKQIELKLQDLIQRRKESEAMNFLKAISAQKIPQPVLGTTGVITDATQKADEKKSAMVQTPMGMSKAGAGKPPKPLDTRELSKRLEMLPEMTETARKLKPFLGRSDIPGVHPMAKFIPNFAVGEEGERVRQLATNLFMNQVYLKSGKAITENEAKLQMKILGMHWDQGDRAFKAGFKNLIDNIGATAKQVEAGYAPEILSEFTTRGGLTGEKARETIDAAGGGKKKTAPNYKNMSTQDLEKQFTPEELKQIYGQ